MGTGEFYLDFAAITFTVFCGAFVVLVLYLHKEGKREGFPIRHDGRIDELDNGIGGLPNPKTYKLAHGQGERTVPGPMPEQYELKATPTHAQPRCAFGAYRRSNGRRCGSCGIRNTTGAP